ncbi:polysaccharide deacetylase [Bacillus sp. LL01]|uniref:polysaccharide deacetylase family protein n=1 Tax=Bacillus sp. LL01 TaxID=1665556 RepID=UPI00064D67D5|nr:polysaccharide deacetylase family protein [Bacillus sp. LL01]KMJ58269.1 polysaccharide deacetylase [Bacillus sp. LL01]
MGKRVGVILFMLLVSTGCASNPTVINNVTVDSGIESNNKLEDDEVSESNEGLVEEHELEKREEERKELKELAIEVNGQVYGNSSQFSEYVSGVKTRMDTEDKVIALTLDACGGENGSGYDEELITFLIENNIKADLFVNARWIDEQFETFVELSKMPLFTIQNHGTEHKPLSTTPRSAWGIASTSTQFEIIDEIMNNQMKILEIAGTIPQYFRSGTAFYDEISVQIAEDLGVQVVNFDVIGDGGATFTKDEVVQEMLTAQPGSIIILHMNQPASETAEGVKEAILTLIEQGFSFVHLHEYELE